MATPTSKIDDHIALPRKRKTLIWRIGRILLVLVILLVLLAAAGLLYQSVVSASDASTYPPSGRLIDVGGYRLHINCTGRTSVGHPTVILDSQLGGNSLDWSNVQPGVATFTRVCSYDRAGYGWSDSGPKPRTSERIVSELHTLLVKAGIPGPYVLVGHSYGGFNVRLYAYTYPQEVAGIILVDASHEDAAQQEIRDGQKQLSMCSSLAPFGIIRLFGFLDTFISQYPPAVRPQMKALFYQTRFCRTWYDEGAAWDESTTQVRTARAQHSLGHLPLVVLTRGEQLNTTWQALQNDLASLSTDSTHIIATHSGHDIIFERADLVIAAIKQMVTDQKM